MLSVSGGTIKLADGQQLQYDWLVLALGSSTSFFGIPGVKDLALPFNDFKDAVRVTPSTPSCFLHAVTPTELLMSHESSAAGCHLFSTVE